MLVSNNDQEGHNYTLRSYQSHSMETTDCQVLPNRVAANPDSFELLETRKEDNQSPPSADERSIYQPLRSQQPKDVISSEYQSLTHSIKEHTTPRSQSPLKENMYQNLPCRSKHHPLTKTSRRELCFEEVVIKKRKS